MRANLRSLTATHAGLGLYKGLNGCDPADKQKLLEAIAKTPIGAVYKTAFERWRDALKDPVFIEATTTTPLAIGLGNSSPIENGLAIHYTYGTPYLPGSAIKGLLRRAADKYSLNEEEKAVLFGEEPNKERNTQGSAAHLVYWDGWLHPESKNPFQKDVITVHHHEYYGKRGVVWPTDFDDPNPVAFLSVRPETKFCIAINSASQGSHDWVIRAAEMLEWGLANLGLGSKTNAGYGYFGDFKRIVPERPKTQVERIAGVEKQTQVVLSQVRDASSLSKIDDYLRELEGLESPLRKSSLEAIKDHLTTIKRWDLEKNRCQKIQALLEE